MVTRLGATVAIGAVVVSVCATGSTAETGPALIRITSTETNYAVVDNGRRGRGAGDVEIVAQLLYNRRIRKRAIGRAEFVCTFSYHGRSVCEGTYELPRGRLVVAGSRRYREIYELAIVGGTGFYANARGTLTATRIGRSPRREYLVFRLAA
jgi:hypothetical protein